MSATDRPAADLPPLAPSTSRAPHDATRYPAAPLAPGEDRQAVPRVSASPHHAHFAIADEAVPPYASVAVDERQGRHVHASGRDHEDEDEHGHGQESNAGRKPVLDIEHVPVDDDPRDWSVAKKNFVMGLMIAAVMGPMISPSIYNPVLDEVKADLRASETQLGLSISLYILFQGCCPIVWSSSAEILGRKPIYLTSFVLYTVGSAVGSRADSMGVLIAMRCLQAMGSSAVLSVGAGSLADMYEVHERGKKLGWYYGMPMMGPALGPLIGGLLGNAFGWRSTMYFLACFAAVMVVAFLFFPDTWRRERSKVYQKAMEEAIKRALRQTEADERRRARKASRGLASNAATPPTTTPGTPWGTLTPGRGARTLARRDSDASAANSGTRDVDVDIEARSVVVRTWYGRRRRRLVEEHEPVRLSLRDINPLPPMLAIFAAPTNAIVLVCSGLLFAAQYTTTYTASITFAGAPYGYNALQIGLVLLAFGVGNIVGSVVGGRYSDYVLRKMRERNGGQNVAETRLKSTMIGFPLVLASYLTYAWTCAFKTSIAGPAVALFFAGLSIMLVYSSTLAYLVDANPGRSASAVACNSFCRGVSACVMSQVSQPIRGAIGDGGLYTLFTGLLALAAVGISVVAFKGEQWRAYGVSGKRRPAQLAPASHDEETGATTVVDSRASPVDEKTGGP
ncbi:hypothetical protein Q5752_003714 [Cryptotrichosporon argae]